MLGISMPRGSLLSHKDKYIVLSGHRRVKAFKELYASTRDDQYLEIPSKVFYIKETFKDNFFNIFAKKSPPSISGR